MVSSAISLVFFVLTIVALFVPWFFAPVVFPMGDRAYAVVEDQITHLSSDYITAHVFMPHEFAKVVRAAQGRWAETSRLPTLDALEQITPSGRDLMVAMGAAASRAGDLVVVDLWMKNQDVDRALAKRHPDLCARRQFGPIARIEDEDYREAHTIMNKTLVAAISEGKTQRTRPVDVKTGRRMVVEAAAGRMPLTELDKLFTPGATDDVAYLCDLRIRFADAVFDAPNRSDLVRFLFANGYR